MHELLYGRHWRRNRQYRGDDNAPGVGDPTGRNDDGFSGPINLGFTLNFFREYLHTAHSCSANNNGNISFHGISDFTPSGPQGAAQPIISPFFADVDTRNASSGVLHLRTDIANELILTRARWVTNADKLDSFQLVLRGPGSAVPSGEGQTGSSIGPCSGKPVTRATAAAASAGRQRQSASETASRTVRSCRVPRKTESRASKDHHIWFNLSGGVPVPTVPEPSTRLMLGTGLLVLAVSVKKSARARRDQMNP